MPSFARVIAPSRASNRYNRRLFLVNEQSGLTCFSRSSLSKIERRREPRPILSSMEFHFPLLKPPSRINENRLVRRKWRATLCFPLFTPLLRPFSRISNFISIDSIRQPFPREFKYLPLGGGRHIRAVATSFHREWSDIYSTARRILTRNERSRFIEFGIRAKQYSKIYIFRPDSRRGGYGRGVGRR